MIKWDALLKFASEINADFIATGHYARIEKNNDGYFLKKGVDQDKDQSYMLWDIKKDQLEKTIFPIGELTKNEVREYALKHNLNPQETIERLIPSSMFQSFANPDLFPGMERVSRTIDKFAGDAAKTDASKIKPGDVTKELITMAGAPEAGAESKTPRRDAINEYLGNIDLDARSKLPEFLQTTTPISDFFSYAGESMKDNRPVTQTPPKYMSYSSVKVISC